MIDIDIVTELDAIRRGVRSAPDGVSVLLTRRYPAPAQDVWDALTDPDRLKRWFLPVSGELRPGGRFQLEGHAGGEILRCDEPRLLRVTFGAPNSIVEVRVEPDGEDATTLRLEHTVPVEMAGNRAGALYVGPGWDGAIMGLGLFVRGEPIGDPVAAANSLQVQRFSRASIDEWAATVRAAGVATPEELDAAIATTIAQFCPDVPS